MLTQIYSAINDSEVAQSLSNTIHSTLTSTSTTISNKLNDYPTFSKNLNENYSTLSNKFTHNYSTISNKFNENYSTLSSGLNNTKSSITLTLNNGTAYIYSFPTSIGDQIYSYTSMLQTVDDSEERGVITLPNENLGENVIPLNDERQEIVKHILELYSCKASKECFKHFDENVIFEDPLMYAPGLPNVKSQFYGMTKLFSKSTTESYKILLNEPNYLKIDLNQKYVLPLIGRAIVQNSQITLEFNTENRKIIRHTDLWNGRAIGKGEILRKGAAKVVSALIRVPEE